MNRHLTLIVGLVLVLAGVAVSGQSLWGGGGSGGGSCPAPYSIEYRSVESVKARVGFLAYSNAGVVPYTRKFLRKHATDVALTDNTDEFGLEIGTSSGTTWYGIAASHLSKKAIVEGVFTLSATGLISYVEGGMLQVDSRSTEYSGTNPNYTTGVSGNGVGMSDKVLVTNWLSDGWSKFNCRLTFTPDDEGESSKVFEYYTNSLPTDDPIESGGYYFPAGSISTNSLSAQVMGETEIRYPQTGDWTRAYRAFSLTDENTPSRLEGTVAATLASCSFGAWGTGAFSPQDGSCQSTSVVQSAYRSWLSPYDDLAMGKVQWRIRVPHSDPEFKYKVSVEEITTTANGATTNFVTETIFGNGGTAAGAVHDMPAPVESGTVRLGAVGIVPEYIGTFTDSTGGEGVGPSCLTGQCGGRGAGGVGKGGLWGGRTGDGNDFLGSAAFSIYLGAGDIEGSAGAVVMTEAVPSTNLATPAVLKFNVNPTVVSVVTNLDGSIHIAAPTMLARVVVSNDYAYWIHCSTNDGGAYLTNTPFISHLLLNPNGSTNHNTLQHTRFRANSTVTSEFVCETNDTTYVTWRLVSGSGLKGERQSRITNANNTCFYTYSIFEPNGLHELYRETRLYWNTTNGDRLLSRTVDPTGAALFTTNTYDSLARLTTSVMPDGSWMRDEYGTNGLRLRTVRPFTNQPPTASTNLCRVTEYGYTSVSGSPDISTNHLNEPRTITEWVLGQPVSRTLFAYTNNAILTQTSADPGAGWNDSGNETNLVLHDSEHRPIQKDHADGTRMTTEYSDSASGRIITVKWGVWTGSAIQPGTKSVQSLDVLGRLVAVTNFDINISGTETITSRELYSDRDAFGQPMRVTYLDGTSITEVRQDCCQASYVIDRDEVATTNSFDALNRVIATVRLGVTNSTTLDAASRPLVFKRSASGGSIVQRGLVYDGAGRVIRETNALGGVTVFTNYLDTYSQLVKQTTYPDGGVRTEVNFRDGSLNCVTNTATFPVRYEYGQESDGGYSRAFTKEIKLNTNLADSSEWTKTFADGLGRGYKTVFPGGSTPYRQSFYNNKGQLWKERDPDGVITLSTNNALGERVISATDSNRNDVIDFNGLDRITATTNDVVSAHGTTVRRTRSYVVGTNNTATSTLLSMTEVSTDGLSTWQTTYDGGNSVVSSSATTIPTSGNSWTRTVTQTSPDNSTVVSVYQSGRLQSVTRKDSTGAQIGATTYAYDAHGRQYAVNDARNGWTTFTFNNADQVVSVTAPPIGTGAPSQVTTTFYDQMQRATGSLLPDGTTVTNEFYLNGLRKKTWGSRTYPVEYTYDYAGRMKTMKTWQNFTGNSGTAVTTWNFDSGRGWLSNKRYADNYGPDYTYTDAGRLATRVWARSVGGNRLTTTYSYNDAGEMGEISYNDGTTPAVTYSYDRRGRAVQVVRNSITTALTYSEGGQLLREGYTGGTLDGLSITNIHDSLLRRTNVSVKNGTSVIAGTGYGYDNASRLATVTDGTNSATYTYVANSPLVGQIEFKNNGTTRMTTTKVYDKLNRLTSIANVPSADASVSFAYDYNNANQRTRVTHADGSYWRYEYDSLGQVTSGRKFWSDGTPVAGQQFDYTFDDIGNRKQTKAGGDQSGSGKREASYSVNDLNQYTQRDVPGGFDVLGVARGTVTVNGNSTYRRGEYFRNEVNVSNGSGAQFQSVNVTATDGSSVSDSGNVFVTKNPEIFGYDLDGNLTNDGRWALTWDGENRLVQMQSLASSPVGSSNRLTFSYDPQSRRIQKVSEIFTNGTWTIILNNRFVYDGWNLLAILDSGSTLQQSFRWGSDLGGFMQGIGGLISISVHTGTDAGVSFYGYDGSGNVILLIRATDGITLAHSEYEPFGRLLRTTGRLARINRFQFSTKYRDEESGWSDFGFRVYDSDKSRWLNRDPLGENRIDPSLYGFCGADAINRIDVTGLTPAWIINYLKTAALTFRNAIANAIVGNNELSETVNDVDCPEGSSKYLLKEEIIRISRSADATIGYGTYSVNVNLAATRIRTATVKTYGCCASRGCFSANAKGWRIKIFPTELEDVTSKLNINVGVGDDLWTKIAVIEKTEKTFRERECIISAIPTHRYIFHTYCQGPRYNRVCDTTYEKP